MEESKTVVMSIWQRRILKDLERLQNCSDDFNEDGIYFHYDESDLRKLFVVITGASNTPYADVPFLFLFTFPANYPHRPPVVKFCTGDGKTRFNPNLYIDGKVCLSILGTWEGPGWTPVMNIVTVIKSIQALVMTDTPLLNEPGLASASSERIKLYNIVLEYRSLMVGLVGQLKSCPEIFMPLLGRMEERFRRDFGRIMERVEKNLLEDRKEISDSYFGKWSIDFGEVKRELLNLGTKFGLSP